MNLRTHLSDINELALGYLLNSHAWWNADVARMMHDRIVILRGCGADRDIWVQVQRAKSMYFKVLEHLTWDTMESMPAVFPQEVHWVSRPGALETILPDATKGHPADLLLRLKPGNAYGVEWLGISCKSTMGQDDIGMKNPGIGTLETALGCYVRDIIDQYTVEFVSKWKLPVTADARKLAIRQGSKNVQNDARAFGGRILGQCRDVLLKSLVAKPNDALRGFMESSLLDCEHEVFPRYVKVTGFGIIGPDESDKCGVPFGAKLHNPFNRSLTGIISVEPVGIDSIGFKHNGHPVCKLRVKFESQQMASTVKASVDPWSK